MKTIKEKVLEALKWISKYSQEDVLTDGVFRLENCNPTMSKEDVFILLSYEALKSRKELLEQREDRENEIAAINE